LLGLVLGSCRCTEETAARLLLRLCRGRASKQTTSRLLLLLLLLRIAEEATALLTLLLGLLGLRVAEKTTACLTCRLRVARPEKTTGCGRLCGAEECPELVISSKMPSGAKSRQVKHVGIPGICSRGVDLEVKTSTRSFEHRVGLRLLASR